MDKKTPYGTGRTWPPTVPMSDMAISVSAVHVGTQLSIRPHPRQTLPYVHTYQRGRVRSDGWL